MKRDILSSSIKHATFNIVFQIFFRCITFLMNAFVIRYINQDVIGVTNVRLLLLESTILFISREAFRRACLSKSLQHNWQQVTNLIWITVPLSIFLSIVLGYLWLYVLKQPSHEITQHYSVGVYAICASCIIEMFCEPLYLTAQVFLFLRLKIILDTIHVVVRTVTFTLLVIYIRNGAVIAFSVAQVLSVLVYTTGYYVYFWRYLKRHATVRKKVHGRHGDSTREKAEEAGKEKESFPIRSMADFFPRKCENNAFISYQMTVLTWSFFKQGIMKQILTEGERYIMTLFSVLSFYEQGVYDIVNNLGSLAARFIFRPIEEAAYFYFSQTVEREVPMKDQKKEDVDESAMVLKQLLSGLMSLGLVVVIFGQSYSKLLLLLYGGEKLTMYPGPLLMQTHCVSILLLAINGITECYAMATMTAIQIDRYNYFMILLSFAFLLISWGLTKLLGGVGFILANCCNMTARIVHNSTFIHRRFSGTSYSPLKGLMPGLHFSAALVAAGMLVKFSEVYLFDSSKFIHFMIGVISFLFILSVWAYESRVLVVSALNKLKHLMKKKKR
ncbi:protein RFT1 homolog [Schistocerca serialis cubense]|uniref:protein RFT1 homolog n=1 Tax=Schistocerca serialis cubense TaxID=2023355 RepID=UPI00214E2E10|nr:protein RFT1 homolog [Schistocerca serialis cubense]